MSRDCTHKPISFRVTFSVHPWISSVNSIKGWDLTIFDINLWEGGSGKNNILLFQEIWSLYSRWVRDFQRNRTNWGCGRKKREFSLPSSFCFVQVLNRFWWCLSTLVKGNGFLHMDKEMTTHSSILAWKIPWTKEPGGLWSLGVTRSQTWLSD